MVWYTEFGNVFWMSLATTFFAFMGVVINTALKSKCDQTNLCYGLIQIHRKVELEKDSDEPGVVNNKV